MSETPPPYDPGSILPGDALAAVQRVARVYTLVECACPACALGVRPSLGAFCGECLAAGCTADRARCRLVLAACACCGRLLPDGKAGEYGMLCAACGAAGCDPFLGDARHEEGQ